jgi:hypothetical protein
VLAHNASLGAMHQAVVAAVAHIRPAGALDDPVLSISAAPRTFGSAAGARGDVEVSQALPWWGTLDARTEVASSSAISRCFGPRESGGAMSKRLALVMQDGWPAPNTDNRRVADCTVRLLACLDGCHDGT